MDTVKAFWLAHKMLLLGILAGWIALATLVNKKFPKPAKGAKWYVVFAHWLLVDWPSAIAAQNGKTYFGWRISIPFITWTTSGPVVNPGPMLIVFLLPAFLLGGCDFCRVAANHDTLRCKAERDVAAFGTCTGKAAATIGVDILPQVVMALLAKDPQAALDALTNELKAKGVTDALQVVSCTVQHVNGATSTAAAGVALQAEVGASFDNAKLHDAASAWLKAHPPKK